ncbi:osteopetrosis-associated transmembrane protein 1 [Papilio machaon]|uniref:osteopetrosis-associated transmembrane protein 1 n=1 Tax=Papilio machaon TaxID=76193 RepID=UPI001E663947|nr:osteopetrosis-associated transmembrane protein 1 [Papilio machaon]
MLSTYGIVIKFFVLFFLYPYNLSVDCAEENYYKGFSILYNNGNHEPFNTVLKKDMYSYPKECYKILESFSQSASNLTMCSILNARPVRLCEKCVDHYVCFRNKYQELLKTVVNGTSCRSVFMSHDRLNVVLQYHDSISAVWEQGNCNNCFNWTDNKPAIKNDINHFIKLFNDTMNCFSNNYDPENNNTVCEKCMQFYLQLDSFYATLSADSMGLDSVCMDIVDSMNATRSIWSKTFNCCKLRRSPEIVFLSSAGVIALLPLIFYISVRYCGPIRDLPQVLKQSRIKQTILRSINSRED